MSRKIISFMILSVALCVLTLHAGAESVLNQMTGDAAMTADGVPSAETEPDSGEGIGQIRQVHLFRQGIFPGSDALREGAFRYAIYHEIPMQNAGELLVFPYVFEYIGDGSHGFVGDSG